MGATKCEVCQENNHKYKCPKCLVKYCSVACFRSHKDYVSENSCTEEVTPRNSSQASSITEVVPSSTKQTTVSLTEQTESCDRVTKEKLKELANSERLSGMLDNPHLQDMLLHVDSSDNPEKDVHKAMLEPIFAEFADECLKIVEPEKGVKLDLPST